MTGFHAALLLTTKETVIEHPLTWMDWLAAGIILVAGGFLGRVFRWFLARALKQGDSEHQAVDAVGRLAGFIIFLAAFVYTLSVLGVRLAPLIGALGIGGLAIAFAAQSILSNFLASMFLQIRRPFRRGDQVTTNEIQGTVEEVNFRTVAIRTFDGERVFVPCSEVLNKPIINHTALGRRRTTLTMTIALDADPQYACDVLMRTISSVPGVLERPAPEVWVTGFGAACVNLALRFWHVPDGPAVYRVRSAVAIAAKRALEDANIEIPGPELVIRTATTAEL